MRRNFDGKRPDHLHGVADTPEGCRLRIEAVAERLGAGRMVRRLVGLTAQSHVTGEWWSAKELAKRLGCGQASVTRYRREAYRLELFVGEPATARCGGRGRKARPQLQPALWSALATPPPKLPQELHHELHQDASRNSITRSLGDPVDVRDASAAPAQVARRGGSVPTSPDTEPIVATLAEGWESLTGEPLRAPSPNDRQQLQAVARQVGADVLHRAAQLHVAELRNASTDVCDGAFADSDAELLRRGVRGFLGGHRFNALLLRAERERRHIRREQDAHAQAEGAAQTRTNGEGGGGSSRPVAA